MGHLSLIAYPSVLQHPYCQFLRLRKENITFLCSVLCDDLRSLLAAAISVNIREAPRAVIELGSGDLLWEQVMLNLRIKQTPLEGEQRQ